MSPKDIKEIVKIHINRKEAQLLLHNLNWAQILEVNSEFNNEGLLLFIMGISKALNQNTNLDIYNQLPYISAKKSIETLIRHILQSIAAAESEGPQKEFVQKLILDKEQKPSELKDTLPLEACYVLLNILLQTEEQLWCMANSDDVGDDVRALWSAKTARIHTSYGRLSSFVTWPTHGAISLAEAGLFNSGDKKLLLRHFMEPSSMLENFLSYDEKTRNEIWTLLERQFPNNRMLRGEPCTNIPLDVTLRYFPPMHHTNGNSEPQEIDYAEYKPLAVEMAVFVYGIQD
jgi:hypothetical protein